MNKTHCDLCDAVSTKEAPIVTEISWHDYSSVVESGPPTMIDRINLEVEQHESPRGEVKCQPNLHVCPECWSNITRNTGKTTMLDLLKWMATLTSVEGT